MKILIPEKCPSCGGSVAFEGEFLVCRNKNCRAQVIGRIKNWVNELNLLEWGDTLIEKLADSGKVKTIADLYRLNVEDFLELDRIGEKTATKCLGILHANKEISLEVFLGALSIQFIGQSMIKMLVNAGYDSLEKIVNAPAQELETVSGFGYTKAKFLEEGLRDNKKLIADILSQGVKIKEKIMGKLTGKSVCFTGAMENKRQVLEAMVVKAGGDVKSSVGKSLDYLVIADTSSTSSKAQAARKFGTELISEQQFLDMVK